MELKYYLRILLRRWPIILLVPLLVALLAVYQEAGREPQYATQAQAIVRRMPDDPAAIARSAGDPESSGFTYDGYYNNLSSEFDIDDLVLVLRGDVFAEGVAERVRTAGDDMSAGEVQGALAVDRKHRVVTMNVSAQDPARASLIAEAAARELEERASDYLGASDIGSEVVVNVIDRPGEPAPDTGRARLLMLMQLAAAVGVGVLLAFLIDYLDDTLYDGDSAAAAMGLPHLATVPVEHRG